MVGKNEQSARESESDSRDVIIDAATQLIASGGRDAATTRAVAKAAGVQAPTIYRMFGDKDGLLDAVAEQGFAEYVAQKARKKPHADPVQDLRDGWDTHVTFSLANPGLFAIMTGDSHLRRGSSAFASGIDVLKSAYSPHRRRRSPARQRKARPRPRPIGRCRYDTYPAGAARRRARLAHRGGSSRDGHHRDNDRFIVATHYSRDGMPQPRCTRSSTRPRSCHVVSASSCASCSSVSRTTPLTTAIPSSAENKPAPASAPGTSSRSRAACRRRCAPVPGAARCRCPGP